MAMTLDQFLEASGAEYCAGIIIHGIMGDRKKLGTYDDGVFQLNAEGQAMLTELEAAETAPEATTKRGRKKAEETTEPAAE